ncbi:MAG: hypothetical protein QXQ37_00695 [Nitrososphaerota archaeon]
MEPSQIAIHLFNGILAGIIYSLIGWLRNNAQAKAALKAKEILTEEEIAELIRFAAFSPGEFLTTVIQGALIGLIAAGLELVGILPYAQALDLLVKLGLMVIMRRVASMITNYLGVIK